MKRLALFAALLTSTGQAWANDQADFAKVVADPAQQQMVVDAAKRSEVVKNNPCPSGTYTILNRFAIYKPIVFEGAGQLSDGIWKQVVAAKGCGQDRLLNVLVLVDPKAHATKAVALAPGTTHADPILQRDAMNYAAAAAVPQEKDCSIRYIENTEFQREFGEPMAGAKGKPWDELWTIASCTRLAKVTIHFVPDKTGTGIHTSLQETKFLPK